MSGNWGPFHRKISDLRHSASELISRSWAESFFGNISMLIKDIKTDLPVKETFTAGVEVPSVAGKMLIATRTMLTMEDVVKSPERAIGIYHVRGGHLDLVRGNGPPTTEISSHLLAYGTGRGNAMIHCHMDSVNKASALAGGNIPLPPGYSWVDRLEPGSLELAEATADALKHGDTVVWKDHGAVSLADDLEKCVARLVRLDAYLEEMTST